MRWGHEEGTRGGKMGRAHKEGAWKGGIFIQNHT